MRLRSLWTADNGDDYRHDLEGPYPPRSTAPARVLEDVTVPCGCGGVRRGRAYPERWVCLVTCACDRCGCVSVVAVPAR